ncbi:MAG: hypothetical protein NVSMB3_11340 [Acidobacteriaceae bacterium]
MADFNQFGSIRPSQSADAKQCAQFEAMLADAVDGTLTPEEQAAFDLHLVSCVPCTEMLANAKRGAAWLEMLRHQRPEPPAEMLERIFAQTSGAQRAGSSAVEADPVLGVALGPAGVLEPAAGALAPSNLLPFRKRVVRRVDFAAIGHTLLQPRLAMTAAMAFFSIALTLNLTGVRVSDLRVSDLKPSSLKRSLYSANAHVVRYYTNLRVVYELESRVRDLQRSTEDDLPAASPAAPQTKSGAADQANPDAGDRKQQKDADPPAKRRVSPGTSRREPLHESPRVLAGAVPCAPGSAQCASSLDTLAILFPRVCLPTQGRETV